MKKTSLWLILIFGLLAQAALAYPLVPAKAVANPYNGALYVPINASSEVCVYYSFTDKIIDETIKLPAGSYCFGLAAKNNGKELYVVVNKGKDSSIRAYDLIQETGLPKDPGKYQTFTGWSPKTGSSPASAAVFGNRLYVADMGGGLHVFNTDDKKFIKDLDFAAPANLSNQNLLYDVVIVSSSTLYYQSIADHTIFVSQKSNPGKVYIIKYTASSDTYKYSGEITNLTGEVLKYPTYLKAPADGKHLYVAINGGDGNCVKVFDITSASQPVYKGGAATYNSTSSIPWTGMDVTPDGKTLYYCYKPLPQSQSLVYKLSTALITGMGEVSASDPPFASTNKPVDSLIISPKQFNVAITNSEYGSVTNFAADEDWFLPVPEIISPSSSTYGDEVKNITIYGKNFVGPSNSAGFYFSDYHLFSNVKLINTNKITASIPKDDELYALCGAGVHDLYVWNEGGANSEYGAGKLENAFTIYFKGPLLFDGMAVPPSSLGSYTEGYIKWEGTELDQGEEKYALCDPTPDPDKEIVAYTYDIFSTYINLTFEEKNLPPNVKVTRYLKAVAPKGVVSIESAPVTHYSSAALPGKPVPKTITYNATKGTFTLTLSWEARGNPGPIGWYGNIFKGTTYELSQATTFKDNPYTLIGSTTSTSFKIYGLLPGKYYFKIRAFNEEQIPTSYNSAELTLYVPAKIDAPQNLTAEKQGNNVVLKWQNPKYNVPGKGGYRVYYGNSLNNINTPLGDDVPYSNSYNYKNDDDKWYTMPHPDVVSNANNYYYVVKSYSNEYGGSESGPSNVAYLLKKEIKQNAVLGGKMLISVPYNTGYKTLADVLYDIEGIDLSVSTTTAPTKVKMISRYHPNKQVYENLYYTFPGGEGEWMTNTDDGNWPLMVKGEGLEINAMKTFTYSFAGSDDDNFSLSLFYSPGVKKGLNLISIPYTTSYVNLADMIKDIEGFNPSASPTTPPTKVKMIARFYPKEQIYENLFHNGEEWTSDTVNQAMPLVVIGEGFEVTALTNFDFKPSVKK